MANKVLGRISTVLAVNAKPLQSGLNLAKGELETFASTVKSRLTSAGNSAERALKGMYTDFQRLERAVKAANSQQLNLKVQNPKAILDVARATERIAKPVGDAQKQFSALSQTVQSALLPVLQSGQKQAENFFDAISRGVKVTERDFANTEARINRVVQAISRANEAGQATRSLATGQELRFQNPEFLRSTSRAAQLQQQAAQLSPEAISGRGIVSLIGQQRVAADEAERLRATIDRIAVTRRGDAQVAQQAYSQQLAALERINGELEQQIALANNASGAAGAAASRQGAFDNRELDRRSGVLARRNANNFEDATAGLLGPRNAQAETFARETEAQARARELSRTTELRSQFVALPPAVQQSLEQERAALNNIANAARDGAAGVETLAQANDRMAQSIATATSRLEEQAAAARQQAMQAANQRLNVLQEDSSPIEGMASALTGRNNPSRRVLDQLGGSIDSLRNRVSGVGETLAGDLGPTVDNLTTRFQNMARQGVGVAAEEARRLSQEVAGINAALNNRQSIGQQFESSFGGAGRAGLSLGVDERSLRGIGAQIEFVQGRLSTLRQEVRGPVIAALDAFRVRSQQLFEGGAINTDAGRRQLRLLQDELARTLSAAGGGSVRRINEQLRRVGDIARGSFGNVGLAIQQAIFAFDDFFSVTGGLDQRIRAAGNNISQLGFILGGTAGLIGGVLVSALAQAAAGLVKWANSGAGSVEIAKALNERLERQKSLLGEITSGFNELADGVGENAFSEASRRAADFEARLTSVIDKLKEFRDSAATALNADVFMADGVVESRQGRLREAGTLPLAAARQALLRDAERSAEQARVRARSAPAMSRQELQDAFGGGYTAPASTTNEMLRGTLEERQSDLARVVDSWFYTFVTPFEQANARRQIVIVSRARDNLVATIASNIEQITRGVVGPAARRFDATANRTGEMLGRANEVGGPSGDVTTARDALEGDTRAFRDALTRLGKAAAAGRETEVQSLAKFLEALSRSVVAREREARALLAAANASARFVEVLGRLREANDAIFGDISNVASQARRDALQAAGSADSGLSRRSDADFAQARSDRLQQELRAAEDRRTAAESALRDAERRFRFESPDPSIRQLVNEAASLRSVIESPQTAPQAAASARQRELFVNDQLNRAFASSPMGRALQDQVDEAARAAGSVLARDSMITQGRELSMTPGERSARELEDNLRRINAFFDDEVQRLGFPFQGREEIEQRREEARRRLIADQMRNAAPAIFGLADSVANAVLQGPSRAALQATDVSTVEGSRELTRLLRGDDAAKDQANLVELQREANRLLDIIANAPAPVAN
jgi:hypothetical protein